MANDSSTGGYLLPTDALAPLEDAALDDLFQQLVVGITGLPGAMVRPRWQPVVQKQPEPATDWCAIGITACTPTQYPAITHDGTGDGQDQFVEHETLEVMASFYGPNAGALSKQLRHGLYIPQNRETLTPAGVALMSIDRSTAAPALINEQWVRRFDLVMSFRRKVSRTYPVLNLASAPIEIGTSQP